MTRSEMLRKLSFCLGATLLACARAHAAIPIDLAYVDKNSVEYTRFKDFVDAAVAGNPDYGFSAADAAYMYKLTGQGQYATLAVSMVEQQVSDAEAAIAANTRPDISGDDYLDVGPMLEDLALTYDWCADHVSPTQKTRWANYAEQAVWNIWNYDNASWGGNPFPWNGWGVNDPANNYHYSFLRATM